MASLVVHINYIKLFRLQMSNRWPWKGPIYFHSGAVLYLFDARDSTSASYPEAWVSPPVQDPKVPYVVSVDNMDSPPLEPVEYIDIVEYPELASLELESP